MMYDCKQCGKSFKRSDYLKDHVFRHTGAKPYPCEKCDKFFATAKEVKVHMITHSDEKPYKCDVCEKWFRSRKQLCTHSEVHTDVKHECKHCKKVYNTKAGLSGHIRDKHKRKRNVGPRAACPICGKEVFSQKYVQKHIDIVHNGVKPHQCTICGKAFALGTSLKRHVMMHNNERPYKCQQCGRKFIGKYEWQKHELYHKGIYTMRACKVCGAVFKMQAQLKRHMLSHTDERPHLCQICGRSFKSASNLGDHVKRHIEAEQEGTLTCDYCGKTGLTESKLKAHVKSVHIDPHRHQCYYCGKTFSEKKSLNDHVLIHTGERPHQCHLCCKSFRLKRDLRRHLLTVHSEIAPTPCPLCGKVFDTFGKLQLHTRTCGKEKKYTNAKETNCTLCSKKLLVRNVARHLENSCWGKDRNKMRSKPGRKARTVQDVITAAAGAATELDNVAPPSDSHGQDRETVLASEHLYQSPVPSRHREGDSTTLQPAFPAHTPGLDTIGAASGQSEAPANDNDDDDVSVKSELMFGSENASEDGNHGGFDILASWPLLNEPNTGAQELPSASQEASEDTLHQSEEAKPDVEALNKTFDEAEGDVLLDETTGDVLDARSASTQHVRDFLADVIDGYSNHTLPCNDGDASSGGDLEPDLESDAGPEEQNDVIVDDMGPVLAGEEPLKSEGETDENTEYALNDTVDSTDRDQSEVQEKDEGILNQMETGEIPPSVESAMKTEPLDVQPIRPKVRRKPPMSKSYVMQKCPRCDKSFKSKLLLKDHLLTHLKGAAYVCRLCASSFESEWAFNIHEGSHVKKAYRCRLCPAVFLSKSEYLNHTGKMHYGPEKECPFSCKAKLSESTWRKHFLSKHMPDDAVNKCSVCDKRFSLYRSLVKHMKRELDTNSLQCRLCEEVFKSCQLLTDHVLVHGVKGVTGIDEGYLKYRKNLPKKIKPPPKRIRRSRFEESEETDNICDVCGLVCKRRKLLEMHRKRIHFPDEELPVACKFCDKVFPRKWKMVSHVQAVHGGVKGNKVHCEVCGKVFGNKQNLKRHLYSHQGVKRFSCDLCSQTFTQKTSLNNHMLIHAGIKPFRCQNCGSSFTQKSGLTVHLKRCYGSPKPRKQWTL